MPSRPPADGDGQATQESEQESDGELKPGPYKSKAFITTDDDSSANEGTSTPNKQKRPALFSPSPVAAKKNTRLTPTDSPTKQAQPVSQKEKAVSSSESERKSAQDQNWPSWSTMILAPSANCVRLTRWSPGSREIATATWGCGFVSSSTRRPFG